MNEFQLTISHFSPSTSSFFFSLFHSGQLPCIFSFFFKCAYSSIYYAAAYTRSSPSPPPSPLSIALVIVFMAHLAGVTCCVWVMRATFALVGIASSQMGRGRSEMPRIECQFVLGICVLDFALIKCRERRVEKEGGMKEGGKWSHFCGTFDACVANAFTINLPCLLPAGGAKPKWSIEICAIRRHCAAPPSLYPLLPLTCCSTWRRLVGFCFVLLSLCWRNWNLFSRSKSWVFGSTTKDS